MLLFIFIIAYCIIPTSAYSITDAYYNKLYKTSKDFKAIEDALTKVWKEIKATLPEQQYKAVLNNQRKWLKERNLVTDSIKTGKEDFLKEFNDMTCKRVMNLRYFLKTFNSGSKNVKVRGNLTIHRIKPDDPSAQGVPMPFFDYDFKIDNYICTNSISLNDFFTTKDQYSSKKDTINIMNFLYEENNNENDYEASITFKSLDDLPELNYLVINGKRYVEGGDDSVNPVETSISNNDNLELFDTPFTGSEGVFLRWTINRATGMIVVYIQSKEDSLTIEGFKANRGNLKTYEKILNPKYKFKPVTLHFGDQTKLFTTDTNTHLLELSVYTDMGTLKWTGNDILKIND